jgi:predicted nucleic acid-binding protein
VVQNFVLDTSVLIQAVIRDRDTARARTLVSGAFEPDNATVLHVPEFGLVECTNVLWKRVQFHQTPLETMQRALNALMAVPLTVQPVITLLPRALVLGVNRHLAIYDALYIVLAESLGHPLITVDRRQADAADTAGVPLKLLTDFPPYQGSS